MKTDTKTRLFEYIRSSGPVGPTDIANYLEISTQMAHRHLNALVKEGKIIKEGKSPMVVYQALDNIKKPSHLDKFYLYETSPKLNSLILRIDDLQNRLSKINDPAIKDIIQKKLKIEWTYESNAIEGSTLSLGDTIFFIEQGLTVEGKPFKDFLDAKNHVQAIDYLFDIIKDKRPITEGLIKEINALLLYGVKDTPAITKQGRKVSKPANPGQYKKMPNHVLKSDGTIHKYIEPEQVGAQMKQLCAWISESTKKKVPPAIVAAIAHYNFVRIHPFDDGNGRGARILMNLILMKHRLIPAVVRNERRREYFNALSLADDGDLIPFIEFIIKQVIDTQTLVLESAKKL